MQIQVNTDSHIKGSAKLTHEVETVVERVLRRFGDRITRVHVHLSDQNSGDKCSDDDKRCVMLKQGGNLGARGLCAGSPFVEGLPSCHDSRQGFLQRVGGAVDRLFQ